MNLVSHPINSMSGEVDCPGDKSISQRILILGSFTGGYFGAHLSNLKGNKLIKNTFTVVCLLVGASLLVKSIGYLI